jgi:hypothetical protein
MPEATPKKTRTCKVVCQVFVDRKLVETKTWPAVDVMKTSVTRAWATRQFNRYRQAFPKDRVVSVEWDAAYGEPDHSYIHGRLSGVNSHVYRRGIFEP